MSDEKLRELERRWKETGSVEHGAAWLKERVRVGDLTQERLELAAYCGSEAAQLCLARSPVTQPEVSADPYLRAQEFFNVLKRWGSETCLCAAILVARESLPVWIAQYPDDERPQNAIHLARCVLGNDPPSLERVERSARDAGKASAKAFRRVGPSRMTAPAAASAALGAARCAASFIRQIPQGVSLWAGRTAEKSLVARGGSLGAWERLYEVVRKGLIEYTLSSSTTTADGDP